MIIWINRDRKCNNMKSNLIVLNDVGLYAKDQLILIIILISIINGTVNMATIYST